MDYNIIEDMKNTYASISLYELTKLMSQWDILFHALGKTSTNNISSFSKGPSKSPNTLFAWKKGTRSAHHFCYHLKYLTSMSTTAWFILVH